MASNLLENGVDDILQTVVGRTDSELIVVDPSAETVEALVDLGVDREDDLPFVKLLAEERTLKRVMDDFLVASRAGDLVEAESLELRVLEAAVDNSLLLTDDSVKAVVTAGDRVAALSTDDDDFVAAAFGTYDDRFADAEEFNLRTPSISRVRETLEAEIGEEMRADFDAVLDALDTARGDGDGLDEVTISLLVAAKNEVLLYDISKWGEDVGIASKATFSRNKTSLEELGLVDTEKVPIDVGRPRLRLKLGDERLEGADPEELVSVAQSMLSE